MFFCGTLKEKREYAHTGSRDKIVVYMGNGTISANKMKNVITQAFSGSRYEVYIASSYLEKEDAGNIHVAPRWDFEEKNCYSLMEYGDGSRAKKPGSYCV